MLHLMFYDITLGDEDGDGSGDEDAEEETEEEDCNLLETVPTTRPSFLENQKTARNPVTDQRSSVGRTKTTDAHSARSDSLKLKLKAPSPAFASTAMSKEENVQDRDAPTSTSQ